MQLKVVIDSDELIKLVKAGVLEKVVKYYIPQAVYEETVERGKEEAYPDAEEIERPIQGQGHVLKPSREHPQAKGILALAGAGSLGGGEQEAVYLFFVEEAEAIISDDQAFLAILERATLPYLPPALALVELARHGGIEIEEAVEALEKMKGLIKAEVYQRAREDLEALKGEVRREGDEG